MLNRLFSKKGLALLIASVLIFVTGCQAVGGVDFNRMLASYLTVDSVEGKMTVTIDLELNEDALGEDEPMLRLLDGMSIVLEELKQESQQRASLRGKLVTSRGDIPFAASVDGQSLVFTVDGANRPLMLGNTELLQLGLDEASLESMIGNKQLIESTVSFMLKHIANPSNVAVRSASEIINGQTMSLYNVHTELDGGEAVDILRKLFIGMAKDDSGLKEVVGLFYDALIPLLNEEMTESLDYYLDGTLSRIVHDRELAVEMLHAVAKGAFVYAASFVDGDNPEAVQLADSLSLTADLYVDNRLNVRKSDLKLRIDTAALESGYGGIDFGGALDYDSAHDDEYWDENEVYDEYAYDGEEEWLEDYDFEYGYYSFQSPVQAVTITVSGEYWNHNEAVQADEINADNALSLFSDYYGMDEAELLKAFSKDSPVYDLLRNQLGLGRAYASFSVYEPVDEEDPYYYYYYVPEDQRTLSDNGVMIVPIPYLAASLGLDLELDANTGEAVLYDYFTDTTITLQRGSDSAAVNGEPEQLSVPVSVHNDQMYAPLRFIVDALGASLDWIPDTATAFVYKP